MGLAPPSQAIAAAVPAVPPALMAQFHNPPVPTILNLAVPSGPMLSTAAAAQGANDPQPPEQVIVLANIASAEELNDGEFYDNLVEDIREACSEFGRIESIHIPRTRRLVIPGHHQLQCDLAGAGYVFVEFETLSSAAAAFNALCGRRYNGRAVMMKYMPREQYRAMVERNETMLTEAHARYLVEIRTKQEEAAAAAMAVDPSKAPTHYYLTGPGGSMAGRTLALPPSVPRYHHSPDHHHSPSSPPPDNVVPQQPPDDDQPPGIR
jgi:splicing factor U2AF subunit